MFCKNASIFHFAWKNESKKDGKPGNLFITNDKSDFQFSYFICLYYNNEEAKWKPHTGENHHFIQKSHFQNRIFNKNHISEAHLEQKSHFQISIFHKKNHSSKSHTLQKSYFQNLIIQKNHNISNIKFKWIYGEKVWICPSVSPNDLCAEIGVWHIW